MGGPVRLNETRDSAVSLYLYGKIIQETHLSRYGADLAKTQLVITVVYSTIENPLQIHEKQGMIPSATVCVRS